MLQWGNVHVCLGKRLADRAAAGGAATPDIAAAAEPDFEKAAGRFAEAARIKPDFVDGAASEANLAFERGKLAAGLIVPAPPCGPGFTALRRREGGAADVSALPRRAPAARAAVWRGRQRASALSHQRSILQGRRRHVSLHRCKCGCVCMRQGAC